MELYARTSVLLSTLLTKQYSTSFSSASKLFSEDIRPHIYAIYGLVRIADEAVDTYEGDDKEALLDALESETYAAIARGFSTNPIVHAFADTARQFGIGKPLVSPFFTSMRTDVQPRVFDDASFATYVYGSAEVVGLMCLKVFCAGNPDQYEKLAPGAQRLGAAYQKVNFLRDIAFDHDALGRYYFPGSTYETLDQAGLDAIIADVRQDFASAEPYVGALPVSARKAVTLSFRYYRQLLRQIEQTPLSTLKKTRIRVSGTKKLELMLLTRLGW